MESTTMNYEYALLIENLKKEYPGFTLDNISLKIPKGAIMGFIGQNGAGKTTTIRAILGMVKKDGGDIKVFDLDHLKHETEIKENIGVVFDEMGFHKQFNPTQINKMFKHIYKNWDEDTYFKYLEEFGLPPKRACGKFSRGMQMKLQIAVALSHDAKLLIMDEPTSGLDPVVRNEMLDVFLDFVEDGEHSILISSHITSDLERIADYITFIDKGKILLSGERTSMLDELRMVRCSKEDAERIPRECIERISISKFGADVLCKNSEKIAETLPGITIDKASLEEIMVSYVSGDVCV